MSVVASFWKSLLSNLRCVICTRFAESGQRASLHHVAEGSGIRSPFALVPLCYDHHQGPAGLHGMGSKAFIRLYRPPGDSEFGLLVWTMADLAALLQSKGVTT